MDEAVYSCTHSRSTEKKEIIIESIKIEGECVSDAFPFCFLFLQKIIQPATEYQSASTYYSHCPA